tara:strand:- start:100 stop:1119 length:1020 start_codon:yes stop_codon:yes gene_type:complete
MNTQNIYEEWKMNQQKKFANPYTFQDILDCKDLTGNITKLHRDWFDLRSFDGLTNPRKWAGNKIIYHFQIHNLLKCRRGDKGYKTLEEWFLDPILKEKLWKDTLVRNRRKKGINASPCDVYECHRLNNGAIVPFKSSTAKYVYTLFKATNVLDPTAGWGGRMLGASSMGISYTGIDTNVEMKEAYEGMKEMGFSKNCEMIWDSCFNVDFSQKDYDLVLTSPPYSNMEIYEHMSPWENDDEFYETFMMPLMVKLFSEVNCPICINMSPKMYKDLTTKYHLGVCNEKIDMRQQLGKQFKTKSQDYIYVWRPIRNLPQYASFHMKGQYWKYYGTHPSWTNHD